MAVQAAGSKLNGGGVLQLDTVRALHQTIVSLRTALEVSKSELDNLRQKYETHLDAAAYAETIKQLTLENDLLKKKLVEAEGSELQEIDSNLSVSEKQPKVVTFALDTIADVKNEDVEVLKSEEINENIDSKKEIKNNLNDSSEKPHSSKGQFETTLELESKFDVTIKVAAFRDGDILSPIEIEAVDSDIVYLKNNKDSDNGETNQKVAKETTIEHTKEENYTVNIFKDTNEGPNMAGSGETPNNFNKGNSDKFNIEVKITSEENLVMDQTNNRESASEFLNVEVDEISARSVSEGDNSVFSEAGGTITNVSVGERKVCEQDSISGNDSEEVDDIELIFTTDEKEFSGYQEDLVSITEGENWTQGDTSTPILVKFNLLDPDGKNAKGEEDTFQTADADGILKVKKGVKNIDESIKDETGKSGDQHGTHKLGSRFGYRKGFPRSPTRKICSETADGKQDGKSFESVDSSSFDNKSLSFDNTKSSSIDRGSSVDIESKDLSFDQKEESLDRLDALRPTGRTHTVCVETDISKCGVMEDDAFPCNLNLRRNTCPNPFQYRPLSHRDAVKAFPVRPLLGPTSKGPRKSSAAQTDISALPNHWRSDTHLAKKALPILTTLPSKVSTKGAILSRLAPPAPIRPTRLSEENRRVLLSDIGFTSMVPELSRSAEPVWGALGAAVLTPSSSVARLPYCCAFHAANCFGSVPSSPTRQDSSNTTSKYWSKSSMQRSTSGRMGEITPSSQRVSFIDKPRGGWRGSMPELRKSAMCCSSSSFRSQKFSHHSGVFRSKTIEGGDSGDSTEELLDEAERFLRGSVDCMSSNKTYQDEWCPSAGSRPYLPTVPRQLRLGHLVKVIAPHGRIALGKVRYVGIAGGPVVSGLSAPIYVGIQLKKSVGLGGDGTFHGRRYFHCEPGCSLFVPFSKVVVAWADN